MGVIWITGGTKGLGREIVLFFAQEGHTVITNFASDRDAANRLKHECDNKHLDVKIFQADVRDENALRLICDYIDREYGYLDCLINNAGYGTVGLMSEGELSSFEASVDINLTGKYRCMVLCLDILKKANHPCVLNVSSASGENASLGMSAYCSAHAGVIRLTQVAAKEFAQHGIRVNCVCPSMLEDGMSKNYFSESVRKQVADSNPMGRLGTFREVVQCISFLCSEDSAYINGENIMITGGI